MHIGIHPEDYPVNYDWLTDKQKKYIYTWFNRRFQEIKDLRTKIYECNVREITNKFNERIEKLENDLRAGQSLLMGLGIFVEFNWCGHRDEWFLATYDMAMMEEDFLISLYPDG